VRGERRFKQDPVGAGERQPEAVLKELRERDQRDRTRATSPLTPAPDAVVIDSTRMGIEEVVRRAEEIIGKRLLGSLGSP
jgi:cytidylate kinase